MWRGFYCGATRTPCSRVREAFTLSPRAGRGWGEGALPPSSLRGAERRSNPDPCRPKPGLLRFARNDEIKIPFSQRAPRPRFAYHYNDTTLLGSLPAHKEGSGAPKGASNQCPRHTIRCRHLNVRGRGSAPKVGARSPSGAPLRHSPRLLPLGSASGRASWNYRVQTGGPSPAPVQRAPRGPVVVPDGRCPKPPECGLAIPPAGTAPAPPFRHAFRKGVPRLSEIRCM
jgi:hypothetical protein